MTSVLFIIYFRTPVDDHLPSSASGPLRLAGVGLYKSDSLGIMLPKATGELYISLLNMVQCIVNSFVRVSEFPLCTETVYFTFGKSFMLNHILINTTHITYIII